MNISQDTPNCFRIISGCSSKNDSPPQTTILIAFSEIASISVQSSKDWYAVWTLDWMIYSLPCLCFEIAFLNKSMLTSHEWHVFSICFIAAISLQITLVLLSNILSEFILIWLYIVVHLSQQKHHEFFGVLLKKLLLLARFRNIKALWIKFVKISSLWEKCF